MKKRWIAVLLSGVMVCGVLAGCGTKSKPNVEWRPERETEALESEENRESMEEDWEAMEETGQEDERVPVQEEESTQQQGVAEYNRFMSRGWSGFLGSITQLDEQLRKEMWREDEEYMGISSDYDDEEVYPELQYNQEGEPLGYRTFLPGNGTKIYWLPDEEGELIAGAVLTPQTSTDPYRGMREVYGMTYTLAPEDSEKKEADRFDDIRHMKRGEGIYIEGLSEAELEQRVGYDVSEHDWEKYQGVYLYMDAVDDYNLYVGVRRDGLEEKVEAASDWIVDVYEYEMANQS